MINFNGLCKKLGEQKLPDEILLFWHQKFFYTYCIFEIANETADGIGQVPTGNHGDSKYRSGRTSDLTTVNNEKRKDLLYNSGFTRPIYENLQLL